MKNSLDERLTVLEQLSQTIAMPPAALVQVIGPHGPSPEQVTAAAVAHRDGVKIISITYRNACRPPA